MRKIIGICGLIGSGKGTVSDILVNNYGFTKISFADRLKDTTAVLFNWPRHMLEGDTDESRKWRNEEDVFWSTECNRSISPRHALQWLGTECIRKGFHPDIWTLTVKKELQQNPNTNYVIPDFRFKNERNMITLLGGETWQVRRSQQPNWINDAISDNTTGTTLMSHYDVHESEYRWMDHDNTFNQIIENNTTINDLAVKINTILK